MKSSNEIVGLFQIDEQDKLYFHLGRLGSIETLFDSHRDQIDTSQSLYQNDPRPIKTHLDYSLSHSQLLHLVTFSFFQSILIAHRQLYEYYSNLLFLSLVVRVCLLQLFTSWFFVLSTSNSCVIDVSIVEEEIMRTSRLVGLQVQHDRFSHCLWCQITCVELDSKAFRQSKFSMYMNPIGKNCGCLDFQASQLL